jgi:hypothetical protein
MSKLVSSIYPPYPNPIPQIPLNTAPLFNKVAANPSPQHTIHTEISYQFNTKDYQVSGRSVRDGNATTHIESVHPRTDLKKKTNGNKLNVLG